MAEDLWLRPDCQREAEPERQTCYGKPERRVVPPVCCQPATEGGAAYPAGGIAPPSNGGDLWDGAGHDFGLRIIPIATQEIVEIAPGSSHDEHPAVLCEVRQRVRLLQQKWIEGGGTSS
jgi:hypothetical protein